MSVDAEAFPVRTPQPAQVPPNEGVPVFGELDNFPDIGFEEYRGLCDSETDNFRGVGLLTEEAFEDARADERTIYSVIDGRRVPTLVAVEHEPGYDADRTKQLTGDREAMLLSIPLRRIYEGALANPANVSGGHGVARDNIAVLIEQPEADQFGEPEVDKDMLLLMMSGALGALEPHEFTDERINEDDHPGHSPAWMGLYSYAYSPTEKALAKPRAETLGDAWDQYRNEHKMAELPVEGESDGTYLLTAEQLKANKTIVDGLWKITAHGFGEELGRYHPVSMEEGGKAAFEKLLMADGAYTAVRYHDGAPACFGLFSFDAKSWTWVRPDAEVMTGPAEEARLAGEQAVYFAALVSSKEGLHLSGDVMGTLFDLCGRMHIDWRIVFESTNLSSLYIPMLATRGVEDSASVKEKEAVRELDRIDYWWATRRDAVAAAA